MVVKIDVGHDLLVVDASEVQTLVDIVDRHCVREQVYVVEAVVPDLDWELQECVVTIKDPVRGIGERDVQAWQRMA